MSQIIKPTVGRKVWFRPATDQLLSSLNPTGMATNGNQPLEKAAAAQLLSLLLD